MKNKIIFFALLLIAVFCDNNAKAQYNLLSDFSGNEALEGPNSPQLDQNLISNGTFLYGMTINGSAKDMGTVFKIKINDNTSTKKLRKE